MRGNIIKLEHMLCKIYQVEGLVVAIHKLLEYDIYVSQDCQESFSTICSMPELLRYKVKEVRSDVSKVV